MFPGESWRVAGPKVARRPWTMAVVQSCLVGIRILPCPPYGPLSRAPRRPRHEKSPQATSRDDAETSGSSGSTVAEAPVAAGGRPEPLVLDADTGLVLFERLPLPTILSERRACSPPRHEKRRGFAIRALPLALISSGVSAP